MKMSQELYQGLTALLGKYPLNANATERERWDWLFKCARPIVNECYNADLTDAQIDVGLRRALKEVGMRNYIKELIK